MIFKIEFKSDHYAAVAADVTENHCAVSGSTLFLDVDHEVTGKIHLAAKELDPAIDMMWNQIMWVEEATLEDLINIGWEEENYD